MPLVSLSLSLSLSEVTSSYRKKSQVPRRELWHAEIARDIQSRCRDDAQGFVEREARYHLCPEERDEEGEEDRDKDDRVRVVPPFVVSLLRGGHMISGASVLAAREFFPKSFVSVRAKIVYVTLFVHNLNMLKHTGTSFDSCDST